MSLKIRVENKLLYNCLYRSSRKFKSIALNLFEVTLTIHLGKTLEKIGAKVGPESNY